jgi:hypothetical protein
MDDTAITGEIGFGEEVGIEIDANAGKDEDTELGVVTGAIQSTSVGAGTAVAAPDGTAMGTLKGESISGIGIAISADNGN